MRREELTGAGAGTAATSRQRGGRRAGDEDQLGRGGLLDGFIGARGFDRTSPCIHLRAAGCLACPPAAQLQGWEPLAPPLGLGGREATEAGDAWGGTARTG